MNSQFLQALTILSFLFTTGSLLSAQQTGHDQSTSDLAFLLGDWEVERIFSPEGKDKRTYKGTLSCHRILDEQFIQCQYEFERPGKTRGLDLVLFNFNHIYGHFESVWFSSTWPIKTVMKGLLTKSVSELTFETSTEFKIENEVTEYVKGELVASGPDTDSTSFTRKTYIRTSEDQPDYWRYHMLETARKRKW